MPRRSTLARLFLLAVLAFGVAGMHTLGHQGLAGHNTTVPAGGRYFYQFAATQSGTCWTSGFNSAEAWYAPADLRRSARTAGVRQGMDGRARRLA